MTSVPGGAYLVVGCIALAAALFASTKHGRELIGRQLEIARMSGAQFTEYVTACARLLARGHSQSPLVHWVAGYLGGSPEFDQSVVDWSFAYAQQVALDFAAFTAGQPRPSTRRTARTA